MEAHYPLLRMNWRIPGAPCALDLDYLDSPNVDFPPDNVQRVATIGGRIARACEDVRLAARSSREIERRKLEPHVR